jgi:hypothetical protein
MNQAILKRFWRGENAPTEGEFTGAGAKLGDPIEAAHEPRTSPSEAR